MVGACEYLQRGYAGIVSAWHNITPYKKSFCSNRCHYWCPAHFLDELVADMDRKFGTIQQSISQIHDYCCRDTNNPTDRATNKPIDTRYKGENVNHGITESRIFQNFHLTQIFIKGMIYSVKSNLLSIDLCKSGGFGK